MDRFKSFAELKIHALAGRDYLIDLRYAKSGFAVMAPHGGGIEPGTALVADAIAGTDHSYYAFKGIRNKQNGQLHISSSRFDETQAMKLVRRSHTIITVHGCKGGKNLVYVGGRDTVLKKMVMAGLTLNGFKADGSPAISLKGLHPANLCNRGIRGRGVQLEITSALRRQLIGGSGWRRPCPTALLKSFALAVRQAMALFKEKSGPP